MIMKSSPDIHILRVLVL